MGLFDRLGKFFGGSRGKGNGLSLPEEKGIEISHTRKERHAGFDEEPKGTLTRWRLEAISGPEQAPSKPSTPSGVWPDKASREAETYLKERKGIQIPWHYGDKFGDRFKVIGLRAGGIGAVFFVEDTQFEKRLYAAKTLQHFLHKQYLELPTHQQKNIADAFLEEALPWLEMGQHANIVPVHLLKNIIHPTTRRNVPFVFSEFMEKGDLQHLVIEKERLLEETIIIGLQICEGLLHAYKHGLSAHKDLKPDNIMVYKDGIYKVTDFSAGVIGTPGYMAPEQVIAFYKNHGIKIVPYDLPIDQHADQFAIGLIMYDVFKGNPKTEWEKRKDYIGSDPKKFIKEGIREILSDDLPTSLKPVIARCLEPESKDRFHDISELKEELLKVYKKEFKKEYKFNKVEIDDSPIWWFNRGVAFYNIGRYASAEIPFKDALNRYSSIPGTEIDQAGCLMNLGNVYSDTGQFEKAAKHYKDALNRFFAIPGTDIDQAGCLLNLGIVYRNTGQFEKAEKYYKDALNRYSSIPGTDISQAGCLLNLGNVYSDTGQFEKAEKYYKDALNRFSSIPGTDIDQARCLMDLGILYVEIQELDKAKEMVEQSLKICDQYPLGTERIKEACLSILSIIKGA